jgi:ABC-2 type transport system permease protein
MFQSLKKRNTFDLIIQLFRTDFKLKYNDSILGFIWVLIKPFALFAIIYFVLSKVFPNNGIQNFPFYLLLGQMFMTFWTEGTLMGMTSLLSRAGIITKINFPRYIVLISSTLLSLVNFLINLVIFLILTLLTGVLSLDILHILWFLYCTVLLYMLITVVSMFLSITFVKFRDLSHIWELFNQLLFWTTPVIYAIDTIASKSRILDLILTKLNPLSVILSSARDAILYSKFSFMPQVFVWSILIALFGYFGYIYYRSSIKRIAEFF